MATANHVLLRRITVASAVSSVTFDTTGISGYTDLKIVMSSRKTANALDTATVKLNTANATSVRWIDNNNSGTPRSGTGTDYQGLSQPNDYTANTFCNIEFYIPNAFASGVAKALSADSVTENNASGNYMGFSASIYGTVTSAVTSIEIIPTAASGSTWVAGSSFSLYGIANAATTPLTAPKADGGDIIKTDGTYWYHTFLSSGIFKPQVGLTCDYLVVAGGGSGGNNNGGGGGAGGYRSGTGLSVSSSTSVLVGAGGASTTGASSGGKGNSGTNSTFSTISATGGGWGGGYPSYLTNGGSGGSGGGSGNTGAGIGGTGNAGGYSPVEGYAGGASNNGAAGNGGGGGGSSQAGFINTTSVGGAGGNGTANSISGSSVTYAGGGGGGSGTGTGGAGGTGGGGAGSTGNGVAGTANTGGGGGGSGGNSSSNTSGSGGSGIIIIRYPV